MMSVFLGVLVVVSAISSSIADPVHLHLQSEFVIDGFEGILTKETFKILKKAEALVVKNSNITGAEGHMFYHLSKLRRIEFINCSANEDGVDIANVFLGAPKLKELHVKNLIGVAPRLDALRTVKALEKVIVTDNLFPKLPANTLNETNLKKLELRRNHLEEIEEGAFNGLEELEILDFQTNKLKSIGKNTLIPLKSVKTINLRENKFEKFDAEEIPELPNLETLDLAYNPMKEINLNGIDKKAPKLKTIDVTGTNISEATVSEIRTKNPNIDIKSD